MWGRVMMTCIVSREGEQIEDKNETCVDYTTGVTYEMSVRICEEKTTLREKRKD